LAELLKGPADLPNPVRIGFRHGLWQFEEEE
jgi:hypothetical protein